MSSVAVEPAGQSSSSQYIISWYATYDGGMPIRRYVLRYRQVTNDFGSRVVSVLDSGAEGPGFKSQPLRCRVTVLGKLFTLIVPLFAKQQNW